MIGFDSIIEDLDIDDFSNELHAFLDSEKNVTDLYSLDRKEGNIALLENRTTGEIKEISANKLPSNASDGDIFRLLDEEFVFDESEYKEIFDKIDSLREEITYH